jgi:hypothetical protein
MLALNLHVEYGVDSYSEGLGFIISMCNLHANVLSGIITQIFYMIDKGDIPSAQLYDEPQGA